MFFKSKKVALHIRKLQSNALQGQEFITLVPLTVKEDAKITVTGIMKKELMLQIRIEEEYYFPPLKLLR